MAITAFTTSEDVLSLAAFDLPFGLPTAHHDAKVGGEFSTQNSSPHMSSPDSASAANLADGDDGDEDDGPDDDLDDAGKKRPGSGGRRGKASSAERRATHNAIERARRESLNGRFLELAGALPTMANVKRPSKSIIVNKSLEWIYESQVREHALVKENAALRAELNELRARLSMPLVPANTNVMPAAAKSAPASSQAATPAPTGFHSQPPALLVPGGYFAMPTAQSQHQHQQQQHQENPVSFAEFNPVPVSAAHMLALSGMAGVPTPVAPAAQHTGSPYNTSEAGSDVSSQPKDFTGNTGAPLGSPTSFSSVSDALSSAASSRAPADDAALATTVSAADAFAALQAAYGQQQQYAALASVASSTQANQPWLMF